MDGELLFALCVLWLSTTGALFAFIPMWLWNEGESFHPHSVQVDQRHSLFLVVSSETVCKFDCCVASISAFVAPRGSSGSKNFSFLTVAVAVSGLLGSVRWFAVGDANQLELGFALFGFGSLFLVSLFELDVLPQRFLEDKLRVTCWLIERLGYRSRLPFKLHPYNQDLLDFLRQSPGIYHLYDEDHEWRQEKERIAEVKRSRLFTYNRLWRGCHMGGAITYVVCVTTSILLNDIAEQKVAWLTGACFLLFCILGWLSGSYFPLLFRQLKGWVLLWNPFMREPHFMLKLQQACEEYLAKKEKEKEVAATGGRGRGSSRGSSRGRGRGVFEVVGAGEAQTKQPSLRRRGKGRGKEEHALALADPLPCPSSSSPSSPRCSTCGQPKPRGQGQEHWPGWAHAPPAADDSGSIDIAAANRVDAAALDTWALRFARRQPATYLKVTGHILVFSELVALLTPAIAMGLQWVTALCDGPPVPVILDLIDVCWGCVWRGECGPLRGSDIDLPHCILKTAK